MNCEDWTGQFLNAYGGGSVRMLSVRFERYALRSGEDAFRVANGTLQVDSLEMGAVSSPGTAYVLNAVSGSTIDVRLYTGVSSGPLLQVKPGDGTPGTVSVAGKVVSATPEPLSN